MKNYISTFSNLTLKYLVFAFFVGFGVLFFGCKSKENVIPDSDYVKIPDVNFEKALILRKIDDIQDGKVLRNNVLKVTYLAISSLPENTNNNSDYGIVKDLTGIEAFVNLKTLHCLYSGLNVTGQII